MTNKQKKIGRPLLPINENEVFRLAKVGCSDSEIADYFGCAHTTIGRRFAHVLTKARATLKTRLRRKQLELALKGDKTMLIWLGKQMLGQAESPTVAIQHNAQSAAAKSDEIFIQICDGTLPPRNPSEAAFVEQYTRLTKKLSRDDDGSTGRSVQRS